MAIRGLLSRHARGCEPTTSSFYLLGFGVPPGGGDVSLEHDAERRLCAVRAALSEDPGVNGMAPFRWPPPDLTSPR